MNKIAHAKSHTHCQVAQKPTARAKTWQRVCLCQRLAEREK
jgi:hypothetical protein